MTIELSAVNKRYLLGKATVNALTNVSLSVRQGEFVAITGPSGSGKSTILNLFGALDRPSAGQVIIDGADISSMSDKQLARLRRMKIGFIFQSFNLIPMLSVFSNVEFPLILTKTKKAARKDRVAAILEQVGLADRAKHKTEELSGGQRQRVAIARALVSNPKIILSDEPTANLDSNTGREVLDLMQELNEKNNVTLIYATHDKSIVSRANRIVNILDGEIIEASRNSEVPVSISTKK